MNGLTIAAPAEIGFIPARLQRLYDRLEEWTQTDQVPAAAVCVGRHGKMIEPRFFGNRQPGGKDALRPDDLFLVASLTKPVTVAAAMMLVERGELALEDKVARYVPEFANHGKELVELRHLMTHTSGLPDMVPNNDALRAAHAPLSTFIDEICSLTLLFPPGTQVRYQSAGTAMIGEIVRRITGRELRDFVRDEIFSPLGMHDTSLGFQPAKRERIAGVRITPQQQATDWHWNTDYWLGFGAPWGGLITSPADFARFCQMMLGDGELDGVRVLSPATVRAMTTNQLTAMAHVPEEDRRCRPWGLGWRLHWPGYSINFGDLLGPRSYGHWGATGTLCWMDPDSQAFCIIFTTQPQAEEGRYLALASNMAAAAMA